ncbi:hypothetical protein POV27_10890 [Aureisphaera galaxeae]|uniref:hypothetical protein n=1 Tax=Aureisphaera galaxeae TaxID=1538023 RepID=UPI00234FCA4F|nr:hypothetical protein [Aureisphaera galaxeae]MDC8004555.1 hypothetical protein [Aureisphaera galaxeae]
MIRLTTLFTLVFLSVIPASAQGDDAYPDVIYVPFDAFRENRNTNDTDATEIGSAIFKYCLKNQEEARARDWNTVRQNPDLDMNGTRYFITYSYHYNPETGICSVTIEVYSGPRYNPRASNSLGTFRGSSQRGYENQDGREVMTESDCLYHAGYEAARQLCKSELFAPGWETRPFPDGE